MQNNKWWKMLPLYAAVDKCVILFLKVVVWVCWHNWLIYCLKKRWGQIFNVMVTVYIMLGEGIFRFYKLWQLRQLWKLQSGITLVVLPQKKAISPLLGGSKGGVLCALTHMYPSGFCAGKGKAVVLSGMGKKELEGGERRGAAAEPLQSSPFSGQPMRG